MLIKVIRYSIYFLIVYQRSIYVEDAHTNKHLSVPASSRYPDWSICGVYTRHWLVINEPTIRKDIDPQILCTKCNTWESPCPVTWIQISHLIGSIANNDLMDCQDIDRHDIVLLERKCFFQLLYVFTCAILNKAFKQYTMLGVVLVIIS